MAHNITVRDNGYAEIAFTGETPWHELGQELEAGASMEQWSKAAGMDWTIKSAPVQYVTSGEQIPHDFDRLQFEGQNVLYRSDTKAPLSIVSDRYKPVQPNEVLGFFNDLVTESGFRLHTAGTLFGGKRMWALAETGKFGEVSEGDGVGGFLLLSTSADKSLATTARFTSVRVVCNNTLGFASADKSLATTARFTSVRVVCNNTLGFATADKSNCVSFTHARAFDHELMKQKLGTAVESFGAFMEMAKHLRKQEMLSLSADNFVRNLLKPLAVGKPEEFELGKTKAYQTIWELFEGKAKGSEMAGHSKWGMLNAVTEYFDHYHPARNNDARLNNTWFGGGEAFKNKAVELLTA